MIFLCPLRWSELREQRVPPCLCWAARSLLPPELSIEGQGLGACLLFCNVALVCYYFVLQYCNSVFSRIYKALRSAGGFRRPLRSLSRNNIEQNVNEADREVHDFRCKLTTCKCQELHAPRKQPGRRMHVRNTYTYSKDGEKEQCCILMRLEIQANPLRITPA